MDTVDSVDLRAIEKLKRDMGRSLMEALEDPETLEIMLNPDGKLWRENSVNPCSAWELCLYNVQKPLFKLSRAFTKDYRFQLAIS